MSSHYIVLIKSVISSLLPGLKRLMEKRTGASLRASFVLDGDEEFSDLPVVLYWLWSRLD